MFKKYYIFIVSILLSIFSFSVVSFASLNNHTEVNAIEGEDKTLYIDLSLNDKFKEQGANPYLHIINDNETNVNLTLINDHVYKTETVIPGSVFTNENYGFEVCIFDASVDEYKSVFISGGDNLLKNDNYNYLCLDTYNQGEKTNIKGYGYYSIRAEKKPDATYKTQRVWLNNTYPHFYDNDDWDEARVNVIGYYVDGVYTIKEMEAVLNLYSTEYYYFADIPYTLNSFDFLSISQKVGHSYLIYDLVHISSIYFGSCYFADLNSDTFNVTTSTTMGADAVILKYVVEAYLTYGKADSNGCTSSTVSTLFHTWFKNKSASTEDLKNAKILDYTGYSSNGNSYEGLEKTATYSVNEKWNTMCSQAGIDPKTGEFRGINISFFGSDTFKLIIGIGGVSLLVIVILLIYWINRARVDKLSEEDPDYIIKSKKLFLFFKRLFDILFSLAAIILSLVFLWWWITLINLIVTKGHPVFAPKRVGRHKKVFKMFKFRSMRVDAPIIPPYEMSDEMRDKYETKFGKFLRVTSLDETLQFINVFIGNMSIVGPRPGASEHEEILIEARDKYNPSAFEVRPGITGYSQVYMRRQHDVMSKAWFDSEYIKKMSVIVDVKIMLHTFLFIKGK